VSSEENENDTHVIRDGGCRSDLRKPFREFTGCADGAAAGRCRNRPCCCDAGVLAWWLARRLAWRLAWWLGQALLAGLARLHSLPLKLA
jgi:hypothetical protein